MPLRLSCIVDRVVASRVRLTAHSRQLEKALLMESLHRQFKSVPHD